MACLVIVILRGMPLHGQLQDVACELWWHVIHVHKLSVRRISPPTAHISVWMAVTWLVLPASRGVAGPNVHECGVAVARDAQQGGQR